MRTAKAYSLFRADCNKSLELSRHITPGFSMSSIAGYGHERKVTIPQPIQGQN